MNDLDRQLRSYYDTVIQRVDPSSPGDLRPEPARRLGKGWLVAGTAAATALVIGAVTFLLVGNSPDETDTADATTSNPSETTAALAKTTTTITTLEQLIEGWRLPTHGVPTSQGFMALGTTGQLELHGSCIYVTQWNGTWTMILWPPDWWIIPDGDGYVLVAPSGQTAAAVGDYAQVHGGPYNLQVVEIGGGTIPDDCPEPESYWMGAGVEPISMWRAPPPPSMWATGLTVGFIPEGFSHLLNEGNSAAVAHLFANEDQSLQFAVVWTQSSLSDLGEGREVTRKGREFILQKTWQRTAIIWDEGDARIRIHSDRSDTGEKLDVDTLWRIAESVDFNPNRGQ